MKSVKIILENTYSQTRWKCGLGRRCRRNERIPLFLFFIHDHDGVKKCWRKFRRRSCKEMKIVLTIQGPTGKLWEFRWVWYHWKSQGELHTCSTWANQWILFWLVNRREQNLDRLFHNISLCCFALLVFRMKDYKNTHQMVVSSNERERRASVWY